MRWKLFHGDRTWMLTPAWLTEPALDGHLNCMHPCNLRKPDSFQTFYTRRLHCTKILFVRKYARVRVYIATTLLYTIGTYTRDAVSSNTPRNLVSKRIESSSFHSALFGCYRSALTRATLSHISRNVVPRGLSALSGPQHPRFHCLELR